MSERKFDLYRIDFHYGGLERVGRANVNSTCIRPCVSAQAVLNQITEYEKAKYDIEVRDFIYVLEVDRLLEVYTDYDQYPDEETVRFLQIHRTQVVASYGVDWDESDTYFVVCIED